MFFEGENRNGSGLPGSIVRSLDVTHQAFRIEIPQFEGKKVNAGRITLQFQLYMHSYVIHL